MGSNDREPKLITFSFFRHFVREVLDTIAPPYSAEFVQVKLLQKSQKNLI